ncbi:MAG: V-type ATP synthase subunit I [Candidatus Kerfeldbacteria bacterium]
MAVSEVQKIQLVALSKYRDGIIELLQDMETVELIGETGHEALIQSLEYDIAQIDFAVQLIGEHYEEKIPFLQKLRGNKIEITKEEMKNVVETFDYKKITDELTEIDAKLTEARNIISKAGEEIELLTPWIALQVSPVEFEKTSLTGVVLGIFKTEQFDEFKQKIAAVSSEIEINVVSKNEKSLYVMIVFSNSVGEKITQLLDETDFEMTDLPYIEDLPKNILAELKENIETAKKSAKEFEEKIKHYGSELYQLRVVRDFLSWQKTQKETERYIETTKKSFILRFWVEKRNLKILEKHLTKITNNYVLTELELDEEEDIPVPLRNSALFSPFESVTNIYGVPRNNEPDPTPFLAPFFVVYFGLALTDAAYGIMLALGAFLAIKILKIPKQNQKLFKVLIWGGISTFILGALFGGWFGIDINVDNPVADALRSIRILDPLANPITVLLLTLVLGIFQVMVGIGIKGWWLIKQKNVKDAIMDSGVWLFFLGSACLWILANQGILPDSTQQIFLYMILAGVLALVATQGRNNKNPFMKILMGIGSLYGLVGYFSDVLSYSRLLALGLSTAIIASVVNLVAFLFKDMIPWAPLGWVIAIVILIGGHIFNLAINVLGAYIHSGRLQFVEFFPKFMEGGGRRFRPLAKESKYVRLVD